VHSFRDCSLVQGSHVPTCGTQPIWRAFTPSFYVCLLLQGALKLAQQAAKAAGVQQCISLHNGHCRDWQLPQSHSDQRQQALLAVCNPPWGLRLLAGEMECNHGEGGGR
jgi:hypothetical protein